MKSGVRAALPLLLCLSVFISDTTSKTFSKRESPPVVRKTLATEATPVPPSPQIDRTTPKTVRAINEEGMELPCTVLNPAPDTKIRWTRMKDSQVLMVSTDLYIASEDSRFSSQFDEETSTFLLDIDPVQPSDAGQYECFIVDSHPEEKATLDLQVIEWREDLAWNSEMRCGHWWSNKIGYECDPEGAYPCCSRSGYCGFTANHCECKDCIDYRTHNRTTEAPSAGKRWRDDFQCGYPHEVLEGPHQGEIAICNPNSETHFCCSIHGWCGSDRYFCE